MEATKAHRMSGFFSWLSGSVSPAQLSELYQAYSDLEELLASQRSMHHLTRPLAETTNASDVDQLYNDLRASRQFVYSYKSGVKLQLLSHYARYCRENKVPVQNDAQPEALSTGDALIDRLKRDGITYVDNRPKNGALWVTQTAKTDAFLRDARAQGIHFAFSEAKQQWWTRDASPTAMGNMENVDLETIKRNQQAFLEWLKGQGFDRVEIYAIYGTARDIHTMLLQQKPGGGVFLAR